MCRVATCCFCVDTERGSFILAIAGIIMSILQLVSNFARLTIVGLVTAGLGLLVNILLLLGVRQKKPLYVLVWLIVTIVFIVLMVATLVVNLMDFIGNQSHHGRGLEPLGPIIVYAITVGLEIYFWIVVYSFYWLLKDAGIPTNIGMRSV